MCDIIEYDEKEFQRRLLLGGFKYPVTVPFDHYLIQNEMLIGLYPKIPSNCEISLLK